MITEDYVSFEIAKLLKEKGFDSNTNCYYIENSVTRTLFYIPIRENHNASIENNESEVHIMSAPTLQMAMKWLREKHNRHISIEHSYVLNRYKFYITKYNPNNISDLNNTLYSADYYFSTYEEACEAAIKYCLENLI